jgi:hypothetical protein
MNDSEIIEVVSYMWWMGNKGYKDVGNFNKYITRHNAWSNFPLLHRRNKHTGMNGSIIEVDGIDIELYKMIRKALGIEGDPDSGNFLLEQRSVTK